MTQLTPSRARELLDRYARTAATRDRLIIAAYRAGLSKREIHARTAIARTTIDRIIARKVPEQSARSS